MLIDNLKGINNASDLFKYICTIESKLEEVEKQRDMLLIEKDTLTNRVNQLEQSLAHTEATLEFYTNKVSMVNNVEEDNT